MTVSPVAPTVTTVVIANGLALVPAPVTADWLTGVNGVYVPMLPLAVPPWFWKTD